MLSIFKKFISNLLKAFSFKKKKVTLPPLTEKIQFNGLHDCGLRALTNVFPNLDKKKLQEIALNTCSKYPSGGITVGEMDTILIRIGLFKKVRYYENKPLLIKDLLNQKQKAFIILIKGHYTVSSYGKIRDIISVSYNTTILSYWELL